MHTQTNPFIKLAVITSEAGFGEEKAIAALINTIIQGGAQDAPAAAASLRRLPAEVAIRISEKVTSCCALKGATPARLVESWAWIDGDPSKIYAWGLGHKDEYVRMQTIWLIGQRGDRKYLPEIVALLEDDDTGIRAMAAWSVVHLLADAYSPDLGV